MQNLPEAHRVRDMHPSNLNRYPVHLLLALLSLIAMVSTGCSTGGHSTTLAAADNFLDECVILFHGMGRTNDSMDTVQEKLVQSGYHTVNFDYPSRKATIEQLAAKYFPVALEQCERFNPDKIHFVTHSLGGILVRMGLKGLKPEKLGRVVMLSPPSKGSVVVDALKDRWYYSWWNGPAGQQLGTDIDSVPHTLGPVDYPVGIITGDRHAFFDNWLLSFFKGANDGKVSVENAKLEGMTDFMVVHESHPYIMNSEYVQFEIIEFFKNGVFFHHIDAAQDSPQDKNKPE